MWEFISPSSQPFWRTSAGQSPSLSYSQALGRISLAAKSCAISRNAFCSSVSVKSTTCCSLKSGLRGSPPRLDPGRLTGQSTTSAEDPPPLCQGHSGGPKWTHGLVPDERVDDRADAGDEHD